MEKHDLRGVLGLFQGELRVINLGLEDFAAALQAANTPVVHVRWTPPAAGNEDLLSLLDKLK